MKIKKYWTMLVLALVSLCTFSCSKDDEGEHSQGDTNNNTTEVATDFLATSAVKEANLTSYNYLWTAAYDGKIVIYEDYNRKYKIELSNGAICLIRLVRVNGGWEGGLTSDETGIIDMGNCNAINDIITKNIPVSSGSLNQYGVYSQVFQPSHGYAAYFTTGDGEKKYMRVYIKEKDYSLDSSGSLVSVTIQYQLY